MLIPRPSRLTILLTLLAGLVLFWALNRFVGPAPVVGIAPATIAPQVHDVPTISVLPKSPIRAYAPAARKKLGIESVTRPTEAVVAASRVAPDDPHPKTLVTTVDLDTGDVRTLERVEPLPWWHPTSRGEVGVYYGYRAGAVGPVVRVQATQALLDIKALRVQATASADQAGEWFAGVGVAYRW